MPGKVASKKGEKKAATKSKPAGGETKKRRKSREESYSIYKACTSPRNLTWFTRPFLLRGWGLGIRLGLLEGYLC